MSYTPPPTGLPGVPANNVTCTPAPAPWPPSACPIILSSDCVFYTGAEALLNTNIQIQDTLTVALEKIDAAIVIAGGVTQLSNLTDVNTSTPTDKFFLIADGVDWESRALLIADISDFPANTSSFVNDGETIGIGRYVEDWEIATPGGDKDTVLYSGDYIWLTGYQYYVWADRYKIDGVLYETFIDATITLDVAHATLDRFDGFIIQDDGFGVHTIIKDTGTPALSPVLNTLDASLELLISFALVSFNTTQPTALFEEIVYSEFLQGPTEWNITPGYDASINPGNISAPINNTKDIKYTNTTGKKELEFTKPTGDIATTGYKQLIFKMKLSTIWEYIQGGNKITLDIYLMRNGNTVTDRLRLNSDLGFGLQPLVTGVEQTISIRLDRFGSYYDNSTFDGILFKTQKTDNEIFQIDDIRIIDSGSGSGSPSITPTSWIQLNDTDPETYVGSAGYLVRVNAIEEGLEFVDGTTLYSATGHTHTLSDLSDIPTEPTGGALGYFLKYNDTGDVFTWEDITTLAGGGDMLLNTIQTVTALKTFETGTFALRNVADTFSVTFTNTATADRVVTIQDGSGTLAYLSDLNTYIHDQVAPALTWNINHALNKYPSVTIVDTAGYVIESQVQYTDANNVVVNVNVATAGKGYFN